jgi:hypothetical protein
VLPAAIKDVPWADMAPLTAADGRFSEYRNSGPGAGTGAGRPQLTDEQATEATPAAWPAGGDGWSPLAG